MEPVRHGVVDVHGQRHHPLFAFRFHPAPGDHRRQEGPFVKNVQVKMTVPHPGQAGHVEKVGRLVGDDGAEVPAALPVAHKARVKGKQVLLVRGDHFGKSLVLRVEMRVAGPDLLPPDEAAVCVPAVFELVVAVDDAGHGPDHGRIKFQAVPFGKGGQRRGVDVYRQAHDHPHPVDVKGEQLTPCPGVPVDFLIIHLNDSFSF